MPVIVFLDEAGNLNLDLRDEDFPVFAVTMLVCEQDEYCHSIVPTFLEFKIRHFGHEAVILHSRDIRKAQKDFGFLTNRERREAFLQELTALMRDLNYRWITTVIRKQRHREMYGVSAQNPYDLALTFCLERLLPLLEETNQREVCVMAEGRGKLEDKELADLIVYPVARHVLDPAKSNLPYEVLVGKEYRGPGRIRGLKVFP